MNQIRSGSLDAKKAVPKRMRGLGLGRLGTFAGSFLSFRAPRYIVVLVLGALSAIFMSGLLLAASRNAGCRTTITPYRRVYMNR
jgi:protein-S-isoprenylcysteine O-methyltransferase Ste14